VQGVSFRAHTEKKAQELGLKGWVQNTESGSVKGEVVGVKDKVDTFRRFVSEQGSPHSVIERVDVQQTDCDEHKQRAFTAFEIRRG